MFTADGPDNLTIPTALACPPKEVTMAAIVLLEFASGSGGFMPGEVNPTRSSLFNIKVFSAIDR